LAGGHPNVRSAHCYRALYAALTKHEGCARMHGLTPTAYRDPSFGEHAEKLMADG
jgi:hypothetical protein